MTCLIYIISSSHTGLPLIFRSACSQPLSHPGLNILPHAFFSALHTINYHHSVLKPDLFSFNGLYFLELFQVQRKIEWRIGIFHIPSAPFLYSPPDWDICPMDEATLKHHYHLEAIVTWRSLLVWYILCHNVTWHISTVIVLCRIISLP